MLACPWMGTPDMSASAGAWPIWTLVVLGGCVPACGGVERASEGPGVTSGLTAGSDTAPGEGTGEDPSGRLDVGGGGEDLPDPVPPSWDPPEPEDNCGPRCYWAPDLDTEGFPLPPDPEALFEGGTEVGPSPHLVYPIEGSLHPINMLHVTPQWTRGVTEHRVTRIVVRGDEAWRFYVPCVTANPFPIVGEQDNHCTFRLPAGSWGALADENRDQEVTLEVTTADGEGEISPTATLALSFTPDAVLGGFYYWANRLRPAPEEGHEGMIMRAPFGAEQASAFIRPNTPENGEDCGGCHALSRDGKVIAFSAGPHSNSGLLTVAPTVNPSSHQITPGDADGVLMTLDREGTRVLAAHADGHLTLWNPATKENLGTVGSDLLGGLGATHPEWSPVGDSVAVTLAPADAFSYGEEGQRWNTWSVVRGAIALLPVEPNDSFGQVEVVVPESPDELHSFPTFSPDGRWLAFVSAAPGGPFGDNTQNPNARLRLVEIATGEVYDLDQATQASGLFAPDPENRGEGPFATWPKFAPFLQAEGQVMFLTFHSHIRYGHIHTDGRFENGVFPNGDGKFDAMQPVQLWFAGVDLRNLADGDPSKPPIWLTLQDPVGNNHLGFWTEKIDCEVEDDGFYDPDALCGDYARCENGECIPHVPVG